MNDDNSKKAKRGKSAKESLDNVIDDLQANGALSNVKDAPSYGYDGHQPNQFKAEKEVTLADGTQSVLFSTASVRSDRVRTKQWDAHNIKQVSKVEYAFIVIPDEGAYDQGTTPRDEIREQKVVSAIDDIMTVDEFYEYALQKHTGAMETGKANDLLGKSLESVLVSVFENRGNLKKFTGDTTATGYMYELFELIMNKIGVSPNSIESISATSQIPKLPNGGNPKTDVVLEIKGINGSTEVFTFSLKNTSNKSVSVHEYSADAFANVLNKDDSELRRCLTSFQNAGSMKDMAQSDREGLTNALAPYLDKLDRWVFGGIGGEVSSEIQLAQYILTHDKNTNKYMLHSLEEYIEELEQNNTGKSGFGTIFGWTYPSKKRGKSIQLKAKIIS